MQQHLFLVIILLFSSPVFSDAGSHDHGFNHFKNTNQKAQEKIDYSETLLKDNELHTLIPAELPAMREEKPAHKHTTSNEDTGHDKNERGDESPPNNLDADAKQKESEQKIAEAAKAKAMADAAKRRQKKNAGIYSKTKRRVYLSPLINMTNVPVKNEAVSDVPETTKIIFGITKGEEIRVRLVKSATSIQTGLVILETIESIAGYLKVLPANTRLFATTAVANGSDKLFLNINGGILIDNHFEFSLIASVFDVNKEPGLIAKIVNDGKAIERATDSATVVFAEDILSKIPNNIATSAGSAAANSVLTDKKSEDRAINGQAAYIVQANPQYGIIQIEETF